MPSSDAPAADSVAERSAALRELALLFLRIGTFAFGGPLAHVAMMEDEVVRRRRWLTHAEFLDLLGASNLIPGPNSTEMAMHIGRRRAGWAGLCIAGASFIAPATLITVSLAWFYVRFGTRPQAEALLYGIKPVIIAVILQALWVLTRSGVKTRALGVLTILAAVASAAGVNEITILVAAGVGGVLIHGYGVRTPGGLSAMLGWLVPGGLMVQAAPNAVTSALPFTLSALFLFFLKVGSILFGSGYVLIAFLRTDLVEHWQWLTDRQLIDAVAIGQFTPGPVFSTATVVGYLLGGVPGACVATIGIFLPAFVFVAASGPLVPRLRRSPAAGAFLDGVIAGSIALLATVTVTLLRTSIVDVPSALLAISSLALLLWRPVNSAWLVLAGALAGWLLRRSL